VAFAARSVTKRAHRTWRRVGLAPIGLHECRHSFASFMIAAGVNAKALSTYMGHASVTITFDRYGHLMPGNEQRRPSCSTTTWPPRPRRRRRERAVVSQAFPV
jgi:integrase